MTGVETIARIRFEHFQNCKGIKRIARELGVARDTVRKVLRSGATEFSYKREVQPQRKLGLWVEALTEILESEDKLPRRERRSTIRLFEELRGRGYDGAHDSVHRFVKAWRADRARTPAQAFIPLRFDPGEAYQFDWSHEGIELQSLPLTVKLAQMRLSLRRDNQDENPYCLTQKCSRGQPVASARMLLASLSICTPLVAFIGLIHSTAAARSIDSESPSGKDAAPVFRPAREPAPNTRSFARSRRQTLTRR